MENLEPTDDVLPDKPGSISLIDFCQGFNFDLLGEVINSDNNLASTTNLSFGKWPRLETSGNS